MTNLKGLVTLPPSSSGSGITISGMLTDLNLKGFASMKVDVGSDVKVGGSRDCFPMKAYAKLAKERKVCSVSESESDRRQEAKALRSNNTIVIKTRTSIMKSLGYDISYFHQTGQFQYTARMIVRKNAGMAIHRSNLPSMRSTISLAEVITVR